MGTAAPVIDFKSVQSAWLGLNKQVPLGAITGKKDYQQRLKVLDALLEKVGNNESHALMPLLDVLSRQIADYESRLPSLPEASPAAVLGYLMQQHGMKQSDLAEALGGQSIVSSVLNGKRELNTRQIQALARMFHVSPVVFLAD